MQSDELKSRIKCPYCGFEKDEVMVTDSCLFFYKCTKCGETMRPEPENDCVFCSYGTKDCPSKQKEGSSL